MSCRTHDELALFSRQIDQLRVLYDIEEVAAAAFVLHPLGQAPDSPRIPLCFTGLVHGNETGGLGVLNQLLAYLRRVPWRLPFALGVALGNVEAALRGQRFIDKDLNRCFGGEALTGSEPRRAHELAPFLRRAQKLVDMHQTIQPNAEPFFIFPYRAASLSFAQRINSSQAVVTHWGDHFSAEGMCADEFVNHSGGVGITIELGQAGFHPYQIAYGFYTALQAINLIAARSAADDNGSPPYPSLAEPWTSEGLLYTWAHTEPYPQEEGGVRLRTGLYNFMDIAAGEELARVKGQALCAPVAGKLLFPKYVATGTPVDQRPTELFRLLKVISSEDLPSKG